MDVENPSIKAVRLAVSHHGVPDDAIAAQFAQSRAFFALPEDTKLQTKVTGSCAEGGYDALHPAGTDAPKSRLRT